MRARRLALSTALLAGIALAATGLGNGATTALPGWKLAETGSAGGSVWVGRIPNTYVRDTRHSAVYLPPHFTASSRYPVIYLLHGLPGSPTSFRLADVADRAIAATGIPFIVVAPVGGPRRNAKNGEWAGPWQRYLVHDVVPWTDHMLPTIASRQDRALAGFCAGGYGAINTGLRHPRLFGTLEAMEGYFAPVFHDGPFTHASAAILAANNPTLLVRRKASLLQQLGTRFYVSVGGNHANIRRIWSLDFAKLLGTLRLPRELWLLPRSQRGHFWAATEPSALAYAEQGFA
jgi:S-formylglutathione hydrolase FrmB